MTASRPLAAPSPSKLTNATVDANAGDSYIRRAGRSLIYSYHGALRAIKLYPVENAAVQRALDELTTVSREIISAEGELEIRTSGEFIFVNATRLRLDLDNYASFSHLLSLCRRAGLGSQHIASSVTSRDWLVFLSLLQTAPGSEEPEQRLPERGAVQVRDDVAVEAEADRAALFRDHDDDGVRFFRDAERRAVT